MCRPERIGACAAIGFAASLLVGSAALTATAVVPATAPRFSAVDAAIHSGINTGVYPGAVVVVGRAASRTTIPAPGLP